jgi:lipid-A-disaccharide synthase
MIPRIMMSAAEVSGDMHGAYLARELKGCELFGMGGEKMRAAGVDIRIDITDKSTIGIIEALKYLPTQLLTFMKLKKMLKAERPDALILIDAQGLNMPLAKYAKRIGIRTIYYVAPQEWLWGSKKGLEIEVKTIDLIISIFKKEYEINIEAGANTVYYGHPLLDIVRPTMNKMEFCEKFQLDHKHRIIALCPGSRKHELDNLLPILAEVEKKMGKAQYIMPIASTKYRDRIEKYISKYKMNVKLIEGLNYDVLAHADLVISKSGTTVVESVILGTPVIMFYKLSRLTYYIGKKFLKINLPYYSIPNLLVNNMAVPEFVMENATADNIVASARSILKDPDKARSSFNEVKAQLGSPGAIKAAAQKIFEFVSAKP